MEESITLDTLAQTLRTLLKPLTELEQQPDRMKRIRVRQMLNQLENPETYKSAESLATSLTLTLGEPSSQQSILIPLKSDKDLYDTLLTSATELTYSQKCCPSSEQPTTITSTLSMGAHPHELVGASTGSSVSDVGPYALPGMHSHYPTAQRSESIWYRAADGDSFSGQIELGNANFMLKKHLMMWDQANQRWRATHIWAEPLDDAGHQSCLSAFQKLAQTLHPSTWNRKEAYKPKSFNRYSGSSAEWKPNGQRRYRPY